MNDMSLIQEFVQEAREYIDEVEPTLIEICHKTDEPGDTDPELINSVFRLFHSMKGSAGFLSLTTVTSVTHEAETLLDKIRNGKMQLTVQITETLCQALDLFREMLVVISDTGEDAGFDAPASAMIAKLKKHVAGEPLDDEPVPPPVAPSPEEEPWDFSALDTSASPPGSDEQAPSAAPKSPSTISAEELAALGPDSSTPAPTTSVADKAAGGEAGALAALQLSPEMRSGFVAEALEQLESAEQALLQVLDEPDPSENLKDTFRYVHSFKGNCGFMGFADIEKLSHTMETLLDQLRNGVIKPEDKNITQLLHFLDILEAAIKDIEGGGLGQIEGLDQHVEVLKTFMEQSGDAAPAPASAPDSQPAASTAPVATNVPAAPVAATKPPTPTAPAAAPKAEGGTPGAGGAGGGAKSGASVAKQDIRVDLHKLDLLINLVGELVIAESMVTRCPAVAHVEEEYYNRAKHQLRRICDDLKDVAMSVRMVPLSATFRKMVRLVHDLGTKSGKKIKLTLLGEDTEVDKTVIEQIADPLVHIVRNSCDHGVEGPEERVRNGKIDTGSVTLEGRHEGGEVWILITDDGRGLNKEKILNKALEKGLVGVEARDWPDERIFKLVFEPGFSTADQITDISGRGVGMDVVKRNIEKLNGRIDITSKPNLGSTFTLRIPLTLAIVDAMLVRVGTGRYMIPTLAIRESLVPTMNQVTIMPDGKEVLRLREEIVPVIRLYDVFGREPSSDKLKDGVLMVAEDGGRSFAFFVDEIIGQQQTVIKALPESVGKVDGFSGCTILGDGTVSLIVDVGVVSQKAGTYAANPVNKAAAWTDESDAADAADGAPVFDSGNVSFEDLEMHVG